MRSSVSDADRFETLARFRTTRRENTRHMSKRWYIVHAYTNFERKVAEAIRERVPAKLADLNERAFVLGRETMRKG